MRQEGKVFEFEFKQIMSNKIKAAPYQRFVKNNKVKTIVDDFDENLVNVVKVSFRDDTYWAFDGDHTVVSGLKHNNGKHFPVWCKVYYGMTYEDEAYYFSKQNGYSSIPTVNETLRARHEQKNDAIVNDYEFLLECVGWNIDYANGSSLEKTPRCHASLFKYFERDREAFIDMIDVLNSAWGGDRTCFNTTVMNGLFRFIVVYKNKYDLKLLKKKLSTKNIKDIVRECKKSKDDGVWKNARVILKIYNSGKTPKKLTDDFPLGI